MKPHTNYFFKKALSGSYSRKAQKQKKRLEKNREKLGREIGDNTRKNIWSRYPYNLLIQEISEKLEIAYESNGGFADRVEMQQHLSCWLEYSDKVNEIKRIKLTFPFRLVKRRLSDEAYSALRRLPLYDARARMEAAMGERLCGKYPDLIGVLAETAATSSCAFLAPLKKYLNL